MKLLLLGSGSYKSSLTYFRLVSLGKHLAQLGWRVSLVVPSADKYNDYKPDRNARIPGVKLVQPWQPATHRMFVNLLPYLFTATLSVLRERPQLVYLYKPTPITIIGLVPHLLFGTPLILDLDDLGSEVMKLEGRSRFEVGLVSFCEHLALRHATAVVVASTYLRGIVAKRYPQKPILILSNGVEPEDYRVHSNAHLRPYLYYFGAVNRLSLIETFLRSLPTVFLKVPKATACILGGGGALNEAKRLAEELGIASRVTFTGWIDMNAIREYVRFGDIALCVQPDTPTVRAASNLKVFQYMALGSVPVVSDVGDLGSYIRGDGHHLAGVSVPAGDTDGLAQALIHLLQHDSVRANMATAGQAAAETTYSWSVLAAKLDRFLRATSKRQPVKDGTHA